jgi:dihydropteroate synthase
MQAALGAGIKASQIVLDPGFGFGKLQEHNLQLLAEFDAFTRLGHPVSGRRLPKAVHRKPDSNRPVHERGYGTAGAVAVAVLKGAHILRVHDVRAMKDTASVVSAISRHAAFSCRGIQCVNCSAQTAFAGLRISNP